MFFTRSAGVFFFAAPIVLEYAFASEETNKVGMADGGAITTETQLREIQQRLNYTRTVTQEGVMCSYRGSNVTYDLFFDRTERVEDGAIGCIEANYTSFEVNCDPRNEADWLCEGDSTNVSLKSLQIDGTLPCSATSVIVTLQAGGSVEDQDWECANRGKSLRGRRLAYPSTCSTTSRCLFNYYFNGRSELRSAGEGTDWTSHLHKHDVQDNERGWASAPTSLAIYANMPGFQRYQRVAFQEANAVNLYEGSYAYRCSSDPAAYVHVKGWMTGTFAAHNPISAYNPAHTCTMYAATPARGAQGATRCKMDINYGLYSCVGVGSRTTQVKTAWAG